MAITLGTYGSGLDVETIVAALVDADIAPKTNSLDRKEQSINAELTAIGSLKSVMSALDTSLTGLSDASVFDVVSIDAPASVGAVQTGSPVAGQYSLEVTSLATSQVLATASPGYSSPTSVVGTGTLTISLGTPTYSGSATSGAYTGFTPASGKTATITLDSSNNTVTGFRDAVNSAKIGITASLVSDGGTTRLLFTADNTGADTAISITTSDADLSSLAYGYTEGGSPSFVSNLTEARSPADASFNFNGLSLSSATNNVGSLIDGVDLSLKSVTSSAQTINITTDTSAIETKIQAFVDSYNSYQTTLASLMDHEDSSGALAGDATARRVQTSLRSITTGLNSISGNAFSNLSELGITSERSGTLVVDSSKLQAALSSSIDDVKEFFAGVTTTTNLSDNTDKTGLADRLKDSIDVYLNASSGMLISREDRLNTSLTDISDDRSDVLERMSELEERYTKQFTAMDTLVGQLQSTSDFLTQQIDAIKAAANR